jgi:tetratricopeptide (TPR) repeat protein
MAARSLTLSPSYLATVRGSHELHRLIAEGKDDSPEADAIRDASDGPWESLSETERDRARWVAEDLYSIYEGPPASQQMTREAQSGFNAAYEAKQKGEWDKALAIVREWRAYIDPALVSYFRGSIWYDAGDRATAALFFQHAYKLDANNLSYAVMFLSSLNSADPNAALVEAEKILHDHRKVSPVIYVRAAEIKLMSARQLSNVEGNRIFAQLEPVLKDAMYVAEREPTKIDATTVARALSLLAFGYEFQGRLQDAVDHYTTALQIDPDNDGLLVARGMILYGLHNRAIKDLERAVQLDSPLIWPYAMLAHHALNTHRYKECIRLCEQALMKSGSATVKSEIQEWEAIAQAALEFSPEIVEQAFELATRIDAANDRAKRNLKKVKGAPRKPPAGYFEVRTEAALRNSGSVERRNAMAGV